MRLQSLLSLVALTALSISSAAAQPVKEASPSAAVSRSSNKTTSTQVVDFRMTKPKPPACAVASASFPPAYTSFAANETEAYLWFYVTDAAFGDVFETTYVTPSGAVYAPTSGAFDPVNKAGDWCFTDTAFLIAGKQPASLPGAWKVNARLNGAFVFTLTFTITPAASGGVRIAITSVNTAACPSNKIAVAVTDTNGAAITGLIASNFVLKEAGQARGIAVSSVTGGYELNYTSVLTTTDNTVDITVTANGATATASRTVTHCTVTPPVTKLNVVLTPATASIAAGTANTLVAKVTDASGNPQANIPVTFTVLSGPNFGATGTCSPGSCRTASDGQVSFTYTGTGGVGQDSITACVPTQGAQPLEECCSPTSVENTAAASITGLKLASSKNIVVIGAATVDPNCSTGANVIKSGGCLSVTGKAGELGDFTFAGMLPTAVTAAALSVYDTAVLNVASSGMACDTAKLSVQAKSDLVAFVGAGRKLIIYDSECQGTGGKGLDYSWLPYPFTTANPGALGAHGTLNIVENSSLGSSVTGSTYFVDAADLSNNTDAVGDMNVMTTKDAHWCLSMSGTNALKVTGPVHAYAKYPAGTDAGLFIYNGLDYDTAQNIGNANLRKIWVLELQQSMNPSNLPCGVAVVGITISPATATNPIGSTHTVTAKIADQLGQPQANAVVTFGVSGINANATGTCNNAGCKTDANGQVTFTYTGSKGAGQDTVQACFTPTGGTTPVCSASATATWTTGGGTGTSCATAVSTTWTPAGTVCNYFVQPLSNVGVPAAGTRNGFFQIFTGLQCKWGANSNDSWITIIAGASGTGSPGAVSYSVAANATSAPRTGTITITDGTRGVQTYTVVQLPGGAPCTYGLSPLYGTAPAEGGGGGTLLTTASSCFWIALPNDPWVHVTPSSGYGSQVLSYKADVNTSTGTRTGTIGIMGQTFSVFQAAPSTPVPSGTPVIAQGGIVNAASSRAGPLARGSFFTIYGTDIGPQVPVQAISYPIPTTAGGVIVNITQGSIVKRAYLHFVSSTQINGIIPSDAPLGDVQITVVFNGTTGVSSTATLIDTSFGVFTAASGKGPGIVQNWNSATDVVLNLPSIPGKPGQLAILWGTGLGPIPIADSGAPPVGDLSAPVQVEVAGLTAVVVYHGRAPNFAGVDNVYFYVPANTPEGCSVPVRVKAGATWSNTVRMAINGAGKVCEDTSNPNSTLTTNGGKLGAIMLLRAELNGQFQAGQAPTNATLDVGFAVFAEVKAGGQLAFSGALNLPPVGTCASNTRPLDFATLLGGDLTSSSSTISRQLDAGPKLTITGPKGAIDLTPMGSNAGSYVGLLGGSVPLSGSTSTPLFLDSGAALRISGAGGKDVGALSASVNVPNGITWTNRDALGTINRATPLTVTWSGGDATQMLLIAGGVQDGKAKTGGGFFCMADSTLHTFTVPVSVLADVPATRSLNGTPDDSMGGIALISVPKGTPPTFTATGLDNRLIVLGSMSLKTVQVQ